jgi:carboxylesterase type B
VCFDTSCSKNISSAFFKKMTCKNSVEVSTDLGPICGFKKVSILGRDYFNFQRIPYMKPPVGKLRFADPQPLEPWTEPIDCTREGSPFCNMNFLTGQFEGELDAMFINIYSNNIEPKKSFPVMVSVRYFSI